MVIKNLKYEELILLLETSTLDIEIGLVVF